MNNNILNKITDIYLADAIDEAKRGCMEVKLEVVPEDVIPNVDDVPYYALRIDIKGCNLTCTIRIEEPGIYTPHQWKEFAECILNEEENILNFTQSNGYVELAINKKEVFFGVAKYGADGDGSIDIKLEKEIYADKLYKMFMDWVNYPR